MTSKAVQNERAKLLAGFANTIATTFLSAGCIGPVLAFSYGLAPAGTGIGAITIGAVVCIVVSAGLHYIRQADTWRDTGMTEFQIFALIMPVVGFVFVACFAYVLTRMDRAERVREEAKATRADLNQAAE